MTPEAAPSAAEEILALERAALDRWGKGDPDGYIEIYSSEITYFDPFTLTIRYGLNQCEGGWLKPECRHDLHRCRLIASAG